MMICFFFTEDKCYDPNDSHEELKLRAQDQLVIPRDSIQIKKPRPHNWDRCDDFVIQHE